MVKQLFLKQTGNKFFLALLLLVSCNNDEHETKPNFDSNLPGETILNQLETKYTQLPEKEIVTSPDRRFYAQYALPTSEYAHGILGDKIEAKQLVVVADSVFYELILSENFVFEDIYPRLFDIDGDEQPEVITIRTHKSLGAGIAIYKIEKNKLVEFASVKEIGRTFRWLNIVAINDIDNDGITELAWIETPHIGGILKVAKIKEGELMVLDEAKHYSNHAIGERNLCLSVLTRSEGQNIIYVPNQIRDKIAGFTIFNNKLEIVEEISLNVDFAEPLRSQYQFKNRINEGNQCD